MFFKQALVGLLKSSRNIQLYLIDLKRGVEMKPFDVLKNVQIAKEEAAAVTILHAVNDEMERRFRYMEEKGFSEISPSRDKRDRIIVAVDEASVLYFVSKASPEVRALALRARELTDKLAKLGRAAGIHVVLATQKVVKETIDMNVQTNIKAKMCFRMNNLSGSNTMLGNRKALDLPNIRGRGIWSVGSVDQVIQVPYLDEESMSDELQELCEKFNIEPSPLHQRMLNAPPPKKQNAEELKVQSVEELEQIQVKSLS